MPENPYSTNEVQEALHQAATLSHLLNGRDGHEPTCTGDEEMKTFQLRVSYHNALHTMLHGISSSSLLFLSERQLSDLILVISIPEGLFADLYYYRCRNQQLPDPIWIPPSQIIFVLTVDSQTVFRRSEFVPHVPFWERLFIKLCPPRRFLQY